MKESPATAVRWGCTDQQTVIRTTLAEIGHADLVAPTTIVIGEVASLDLRSISRP